MKLEAFKGRGNNDYLASHDLEDIITLVDARPEIAYECCHCDRALRTYLSKELMALVSNQNFLAALPGHLNYPGIIQSRSKTVLKRFKAIAFQEE